MLQLSQHLAALAERIRPAATASAHCDGPCGIYDPASARIAAEAARSMTNKILALPTPSGDDAAGMAQYASTVARYSQIKEEQAELAKRELLVLWTDYFKPAHLEARPDLHNIFWQAAKLCSSVKVELSATHADELMDAIEAVHNIFWSTKDRSVEFYTAG